jgi:uncharacterized protein YbjT (DUF2867 family)
MSESQRLIAVFGATGAQGGSVVNALHERGTFRVRALTRKPENYAGVADEVVLADLDRPETLPAAFAGAHGVFLVTNFWEPGTDEIGQGAAAVTAAKEAGVSHFVWSTLANVEALSDGRYTVEHFTHKAQVDALVRDAGFPSYTFVQPPFYFENLSTHMAPQALPDGRRGWALPLPSSARVVHAGSVGDVGGVVAGAFENPDRVGDGAYVSSAAAALSFDDIVAILNSQGHDLVYQEVPGQAFATFFPGAAEIAQMMAYWQEFTYLGPDADAKIALGHEITTAPITDFATWAKVNMPVTT